jgi:uncharacterized membrane protein YqhA
VLRLRWMVALHITFVVSGLLLAYTDSITARHEQPAVIVS